MIFNIPGLMINLRKPEIDDIGCLMQWLSSESYLDNIGGKSNMEPYYYEMEARRILQDNADDYTNNKYLLAEDRFTGVPIALVMISKIDWRNRHAEYSYIVGDSTYRAKLVAGDINVVMYNYFFCELNLNKIYGYVFASNAVSIRINTFGGSHDGTLRRHRIKGDSATDVHVFSITELEFAAFVSKYAATLLKKHIERGLIKCPRV